MEKAPGELGLSDLSKEGIRRTIDQLQDRSSSVLLFALQWKDIEEQFDSTRNALEARAMEVDALEESFKGRILEVEKWKERVRLVEARDKELDSIDESIKQRLNELEKREKEFDMKQKVDTGKREVETELMEISWKQLDLVLESVDVKLKEIETKAKDFFMLKKPTDDGFKELKAMQESIQKEKEVLAKIFETRRKWLGEGSCNCESKFVVMNKEIELKEKKLEAWAKELESKETKLEKMSEKELDGARENSSLEFEQLISLLAANLGCSVSIDPKCPLVYLNRDRDNVVDGSIKNKAALMTLVLSLDPAKLVLDVIEGSYWPYLNKGDGELDDRVVRSCIVLLERLMKMNPNIESEVKKEAVQLGFEWVVKATMNPENSSLVLGCLLFVAVYGLASFSTPPLLLKLLDHVLSYDQAPKLFQLLGFTNKVSGVIETLIKKEEYFPAIRFICEFRLFKFNPGSLMFKYLNTLEKAAHKAAEMDGQRAFREKQKADVAIALEYIKEKKLESKFPVKVVKKILDRLEKQLAAAAKAVEPIPQSDEKCGSMSGGMEIPTTIPRTDAVIPSEQKNEARWLGTTEPMAPYQTSTVNEVGNVSISSGAKIEEPGEIFQSGAIAPLSLPSTENELNVLSGSTNGETSRLLAENNSREETELLYALRCAPNPAKHVVDSAMGLCPTNTEGEYEFKLRVSSDSSLLLLNELKKLSAPVEQTLKDEAKKLAVSWKSKLLRNKPDHVEVVCFMQFLGIFGVVSEFQANELLALLDNVYWRTVSPDLCQFLGLSDAIPDFIQNMTKSGQRLRAINYIYSLDVIERFPPVPIINDFLRITKTFAERSYKNAKNSSTTLQVAAMNKRIKALRGAVKCILNHNLESHFQLASLEGEIKSLIEEKSKLCTQGQGQAQAQAHGSKPDSVNPQTQKAKSELPVEAGPVASTTASKPSTFGTSSVSGAQRADKQRRGRKRRWRNEQSPAAPAQCGAPSYVASHPSNQHTVVPSHVWAGREDNRGGMSGDPQLRLRLFTVERRTSDRS